VTRHAETLGVEIENVPSEAISSSPEEIAENTAKDVWHPYGKALATDQSVMRFISCIVELSGIRYELAPDGLLTLSPVSDSAVALPGTSISREGSEAEQPPDESGIVVPEPSLEDPEAIPVEGDQASVVTVSCGTSATA
jgi:hypothetical protein